MDINVMVLIYCLVRKGIWGKKGNARNVIKNSMLIKIVMIYGFVKNVQLGILVMIMRNRNVLLVLKGFMEYARNVLKINMHPKL